MKVNKKCPECKKQLDVKLNDYFVCTTSSCRVAVMALVNEKMINILKLS